MLEATASDHHLGAAMMNTTTAVVLLRPLVVGVLAATASAPLVVVLLHQQMTITDVATGMDDAPLLPEATMDLHPDDTMIPTIPVVLLRLPAVAIRIHTLEVATRMRVPAALPEATAMVEATAATMTDGIRRVGTTRHAIFENNGTPDCYGT